jgi:acetyltransferase-like isoleucine patch superfamily enzyme
VVVLGLGHGLGVHGMTFRADVLVVVISRGARSSARAPSSCGVAVGEQAVAGTDVTVTGDVQAGAVAGRQ